MGRIDQNMTKETLLKLLKGLSIKSFENAEELLEEAIILFDNLKFHRAYFLSQIAVEEIGKHIICSSAIVNVILNKFNLKRFNIRFSNHNEKCSMLNFFEDINFSNIDSIKEMNFDSLAINQNKMKMMSMYSDFIEDYAFKPSEIDFKQVAEGNIHLLKQRIEWFRNIEIIELLSNIETLPEEKIKKLYNSYHNTELAGLEEE